MLARNKIWNLVDHCFKYGGSGDPLLIFSVCHVSECDDSCQPHTLHGSLLHEMHGCRTLAVQPKRQIRRVPPIVPYCAANDGCYHCRQVPRHRFEAGSSTNVVVLEKLTSRPGLSSNPCRIFPANPLCMLDCSRSCYSKFIGHIYRLKH